MQHKKRYVVIYGGPAHLHMALSMFHPFKLKVLCLCFSNLASLHSVGLSFRSELKNAKSDTKKHQPWGLTWEHLISSFGNTHYDHVVSPVSPNTSYFLFCSNLDLYIISDTLDTKHKMFLKDVFRKFTKFCILCDRRADHQLTPAANDSLCLPQKRV